jgi:hypothetical protein
MIPSAETSRRAAASFALALVALLVLAAAPVAASVPPPDSDGAVVKCRYHTKADTNWAFETPLRRIVVTPPEMFAMSSHQTVGWRFVVKRLIAEGDNPSWTVTYMSPTQKRLATSSQTAEFETMRVDVAVPKDVGDRRNVSYTVALKKIWYRADGGVQSKTSYPMRDYPQYLNGELWDSGFDHCPGLVWAAI